MEYHRAQIRQHFGFRECGVADADKLTDWLIENVCQVERHHDLVKAALLARCRTEQVEPPASGRVDRIISAALHRAEQQLCARIVSRLDTEVIARLDALVTGVDESDDGAAGRSGLGLIKSDPGNISLESMLVEIDKLNAVRAVGLPVDLFADVAPKVVTAWRRRGDGGITVASA